jgi:Tol biopolymer transport system component
MIPQNDDFERLLTSWLRTYAPDEAPAPLVRVVAARTAATRRRPGWATAVRWLPWNGLALPQVRYSTRTAWLLAVVAVIAAMGLGILAMGALRRPPPVGPARSGLIAFDSGGDIVVMDAGRENRRHLTSGPALETSPSFSPDGTRIAYWRRELAGMPASLWVMNADGSMAHNVTGSVDFAGSEGRRVAWSPDSSRVAFAVGDYFWSSRLFVVGADGAALSRMGDGSLARSDPAWSPDGTLIAFRGHTTGVGPDASPADPAIGVYVIAADGTGERRVSQSARAGGAPNHWAFGGPGVGTAPSWSVDGKTLLYATGPVGTHTLAIAALGGSIERTIDLPTGDHLLPVFSPDASRIAYQDVSPTGDGTTFVVNADGTGGHVLGEGEPTALSPLLWSPDGRFIVTETVDPSTIHLAAADAAVGSVATPPESIPLGPATTSWPAERVSWQRLAP